jgi:protein-S-isoprenylcysteine O-methyltransferase Ste14
VKEPEPATSGVRFPPPLIFVLGLFAGFLIQRRFPVPIASWGTRTSRVAGGLVAAVGIALAMWAVAVFHRVGTSPNPTKPTAALAGAGPYRFSRNPMYVGLTLLAVGVALAFNALWLLVSVPVSLWILATTTVAKEERYLEAAFGDVYRDYKRRVRRWV